MKNSAHDASKSRGHGSHHRSKETDGVISFSSRMIGHIARPPLGNQTYSVKVKIKMKFYIDRGNNHELVKKILSRRSWLTESMSSAK